jgi:hypothetical protein
MDAHNDREAKVAKLTESHEVVVALQKHLEEIVGGQAFRASHRSGRFLRYIVEQAIAGRFDSLKERVIGAELFARAPSYDTGQDAIVRVAASDVRRRLLQHYDQCVSASEFRIIIPQGSYIPEILHAGPPGAAALEVDDAPPGAATSPASPSGHEKDLQGLPVAPPIVPQSAPSRMISLRWFFLVLLLAVSSLALCAILWRRSGRPQPAHAAALTIPPVSLLPWSAFFGFPKLTHLITSDPDIFWIQRITGSPISVSDYANHVYLPAHNSLTPEMKQICLGSLRGDKSASVDTPIAVNIGNLAQRSSSRIDVHTARDVQFSDLKTDDNFIFLGSLRSDPWISLFNDQLDFQFVVSEGSIDEVIRNVRPKPGEQSFYSQTAKGGATGQSFAIVAFVRNPDQDGQVLLLAGLNAEGTRAAGKLVTDLPRLSRALQECGISSGSPLTHFEMLLRVKMMANTPSESDLVTCHILPETSRR